MAISTRWLMLNLVAAFTLVGSVGQVGFAQPAVTGPTASPFLKIRTETQATQQSMAKAEARGQELQAQLRSLKTLREQEQQDFQRFHTLVDTYGRRAMAQRLQVARTRLQRERTRQHQTRVTVWEAQLQTLAETALALDDKLYHFERQRTAHFDRPLASLSTPSVTPQELQLAEVQQALIAQRAAWRAHAEAVAVQTRTLTELITQYRARQLARDEHYRFLLSQTFWMRDSSPINGGLIRDALAGTSVTVTRVRLLLQSEWARLRTGFSDSVIFWFALPLVLVLLPWLISRMRRYLRMQVDAAMA